MADVTISSAAQNSTARGMRAVVFVTADIGYWFSISGTDQDFVYRKTTDGGATWGAEVQIGPNDTDQAFDVWFDQWTPGDSGTLIHLWWFGSAADDVFYQTLDTNGDTLGTQRVVFTGATASTSGRGLFVSGTKTRSGYLYCAYDIDAGSEKGLHRSTDAGVTWSSSLDATFVEATLDQCLLFPASNTGDDNDCWAVYEDASADALTLKMWDSSAAAAVESATIVAHVGNGTDLTGQYGFSASVRHSDGHLILSAITARDTATSDHQVFDITGTGSIAELTAITTDIDDHYNNALFIDQATDDIYVAYNGKRDGSETLGTSTKVYYVKSTDDGSTWSAGDTAYMEGTAGAVFQVWAPLTGPRFFVGWRVGTTLVGNAVNSIGLATTDRRAEVTWAELEAPTAPRRSVVTFAELEVPLAPRRAKVTVAELELPLAPRRVVVTFAEIEAPSGPRRALVTWAELETGLAPRRSLVTWAELETPDPPTTDRRGRLTYAELEIPTAPRRVLLTFTEVEVPLGPRRPVLVWAELEVPTGPRRAAVTWAEIEAPNAPRRAQLTWVEAEFPDAPRRARLTFAETEIPDAPRRALVTWAEVVLPEAARRGVVTFVELEVPVREIAAVRLTNVTIVPQTRLIGVQVSTAGLADVRVLTPTLTDVGVEP